MRVIIKSVLGEQKFHPVETPDFSSREKLAAWIEDDLRATATDDFREKVMAWVNSDDFIAKEFLIMNGLFEETWKVFL